MQGGRESEGMNVAARADHRVAVVQLGARRHYAVPRALHEAGCLDRLITDACADIWPWRLMRWVPERLLLGTLGSMAARRTFLPREKVRWLPGFVWSSRCGTGRRRPSETRLQYWVRQNRLFCEQVVREGIGNADAVYMYNGAGLEILQAARSRGVLCVVDQTSAAMRHDARLLGEEARRWPEWVGNGDRLDGWEAMAKREESEWELADRIICGSQYVVDSIRAVGGPAEKCAVVPYGYEAAEVGSQRSAVSGQRSAVSSQRSAVSSQRSEVSRGPLRVLFVGTLCLRKGIPYLYEAMKLLKEDPIEFRVVGPSETTEEGIRRLRERAEVLGAVPRSELAAHYAWAGVLVLPTISEGSAGVCNEARSFGVPVVTTAHAGSSVVDGEDGFLVPIRSGDELAGKLRQLASNRDLLPVMASRAIEKAKRQTLAAYGHGLRSAMWGTD